VPGLKEIKNGRKQDNSFKALIKRHVPGLKQIKNGRKQDNSFKALINKLKPDENKNHHKTCHGSADIPWPRNGN
jgi:hypothetical protein